VTLPRELLRYLFWQLPGWVLVGLVVVALNAFVAAPAWVVVTIIALYVVKDLLLYPVMRRTFGRPVQGQLVGLQGEAVESLAPAGYVRVRGELWRAEQRSGREIAPGARVVVREVRGLTLVVEEIDRRA
jgi:membrane-bound ClpP family serine protease